MILHAPILVVIAQSMLAFFDNTPIFPLILQGLGGIHWLLLHCRLRYSVGRAFGLAMCIQNIGLTIFPLIVAAIYNMHNRYLPETSIFFLSCAAFAIFVALLLLISDRKTGGKLKARGSPSPGSLYTTPSGHSLHPNHNMMKVDTAQRSATE